MAHQLEDTLALLHTESEVTASESTDTNSTASGIRGPGRTVDALLSAAGRRLERLVSHIADQWSGGPNVVAARMLPRHSGRPSCPCQKVESKVGSNRSNTTLDPKSLLRFIIRFSTYRCHICSRSYPEILLQHRPFLQDCIRLIDWIRCVRSLSF